MRWRAALAALVLTALVAGATVGLLRSARATGAADRVGEVTAGLRCPACQGESVADSRSPIAAAMRQVVADQLAQGRSPAEIRQWFVQRYGSDVLTEPPAHGATALLWAVPALTLLGAGYAALRTLRPRRPPAPAPGPARGGTARPASGGTARPASGGRAARRAWWAGTAGLVSLVAAVAVAADRLDRPAQQPPVDPVAVTVQLARDLESQDRYAAAAQLYREALQERPDDTVRLRLAFALLRAGDAASAEQTAREILTRTPESPEGLLVLGLAQRGEHSAEAARTLRRFLAVAPEHPAAVEISRLLSAGS